jgi:2-polyprenyl-6-methoxyphenol hydroxylase-like FAD-dependent oxidoreductase
MVSNLNVGIVGGSIAGCSAAILLGRAGHRVTVFERSSHGLVGRGGGIGTTGTVFDALVADDLLDADFPHTIVTNMAFTAARPASDRLGVSPWQMPMNFRAFHWSALWTNLRKRVRDETYLRGHEVSAVTANTSSGATVRLADGAEHHFDLVLFADGYQSTGRRALFPDRALSYRGYLLWRGLLAEREMDDSAPLEDGLIRLSYRHMPGDIVLYFIPNEYGSAAPGNRIFNWAAYVPLAEADLPEFMIDKDGRHRVGTIPPGHLREDAETALKTRLADNLPSYFGEIVGKTQHTYVQLIYTMEVPRYTQGRAGLIGDAGMVIQPFTGSGVFKGLNNVRDLLGRLQTASSLDDALNEWSAHQVGVGRHLLALGRQMEQALIWNRLDFTTADAATTEAWWHAAVKWPDEFSLEKR